MSNPLRVSFEFFPPKGGDAEAPFWNTVKKLELIQPDFVSVTYGAGSHLGNTRQNYL
jgi:methylenetetrahydrofolate reductase (NADPH)